MAVLQVRNVSKKFGDLEVLKDISFDVNKGEVVAIIGPSGSGKSTLLRCINQLETVTDGKISVCGMELISSYKQIEQKVKERVIINNDSGRKKYKKVAKIEKIKIPQYATKDVLRQIRLKIGLVFQNFNLFPHYSVIKNISVPQIKVLKKSREEADKKSLQLLLKMGLESKANAYPCELSGGQQQRVSIARALAINPEILFFDEPTSALDPELTGEILKVIKELAAEKMTMVIVTHEMEFAKDVADKIIFMDNGIIIEEGSSEEVFSNTRSDRTKAFLTRYNNK